MAFVFYDTETTGLDTTFDQILQFAAILTDDEFNERDRFEVRCRLLPYVVPTLRALQTTKTYPKLLTDQSLPSHYEAICEIATKLQSWSPAIFIGYNSLSFDETLLRQSFYKNLKPIYLTNTTGNTRADVLHLVQAASVYMPNSIVVPSDESGRPTRRLEAIAPANGFNHQNAHDAMADVKATIFMARLVRRSATKVWNALMPLTSKPAVIERVLSNKVLSLTEFNKGVSCSWLVVGCGQNPEYDAQLGVFDLHNDPTDYVDMSVEQLIEVLNGPNKAIRCIRANNQPILLSRATAGPDLHGLGVNDDEIEKRARIIHKADDFQARVGEAISKRNAIQEPSIYVEERIYDGFPSRSDELLMQRFHQTSWERRAEILGQIEDQRIHELGYRLIYIEKPNALSAEKRTELDEWCGQRLKSDAAVPWLTVAPALEEAEKLLAAEEIANKALVIEVKEWLQQLQERTKAAQLPRKPQPNCIGTAELGQAPLNIQTLTGKVLD
jgi:exodeoxyribonuclease I